MLTRPAGCLLLVLAAVSACYPSGPLPHDNPLDPMSSLDGDGDGVPNNEDAFPEDPRESRDADRDGVGDLSDNCPAVANAGQSNRDSDAPGDACDPCTDADGDGYGDGPECTAVDCDDAAVARTTLSCGDGYKCRDEACDDGNVDETDGCISTCKLPACGDGFVWAGHEQCDDAGESATCYANCTRPRCGDGVRNPALHEGCDDGNAVSGDGCTPRCHVEGSAEPAVTFFAASPNLVREGVPTTVTWSWSYEFAPSATPTCSISPDVGTVANGASSTVTLTTPTTFTLTCLNGTDLGVDQLTLTPVPTASPPSFKRLAIAIDGICAVKLDDTLACWGENRMTNAPTGPISQVSLSWNTACARRPDGTGLCWGYDSGGQISGTPQEPLVDLAAGETFACGIREQDGCLRCWGESTSGALGPPTGSFSQIRASADSACGIYLDGSVKCWGGDYGPGYFPVPGETFTAISLGDQGCGIRTDGAVRCWTRTFSATTPLAGSFRSIDAKAEVTCGVRDDGAILCWGNNAPTPPAGSFSAVAVTGSVFVGYTACGIDLEGKIQCFGESHRFGSLTPPVGAVALAVGGGGYSGGSAFACGLLPDGSPTCWGQNEFGRAAPSPGPFASIATGYGYACGRRRDGSLTCWGSNSEGVATPPTGAFDQLGAGDSHACAVRADGTMACWGSQGWGETSVPPGSYARVTAGSNVTCALRTDGSAKCWGRQTNVEAPGPFVAIDTGGSRTCAVRADRRVTCWEQYDGEAGVTTEEQFRAVSVGSNSEICGIKLDGTLACWGLTGRPAPPPGTFVSLSVGNGAACAIRSDGVERCWGALAR